jgi:hypothetical protein
MLEMDCAWGVTGRQSLRGDAPTRLPEAAKALQHGKWPRRCGLIVAAGGRTFTLSLQGDRFAVSGATLPEIDDARSVREIIEQRVERLFELDDLLVALFDAFLRTRIGSAWPTVRGAMSEWILRRAAGPTEAPPESTRAIRDPREGDLLAVLDAGAYGFSMASNYNFRPRAAEVLLSIIDGDEPDRVLNITPQLIRRGSC